MYLVGLKQHRFFCCTNTHKVQQTYFAIADTLMQCLFCLSLGLFHVFSANFPEDQLFIDLRGRISLRRKSVDGALTSEASSDIIHCFFAHVAKHKRRKSVIGDKASQREIYSCYEFFFITTSPNANENGLESMSVQAWSGLCNVLFV